MKIKELFKVLETTAGSNDKLAIVNANKSDVLKEVFQYTFDNQKKYGVKNAIKVPSNDTVASFEDLWPVSKQLLDDLASRKLTGNAARNAIVEHLKAMNEDDQDIFLRILDKQSKIGISDSLLTKIWPDLVSDFEVALAHKYADRKHKVDITKDNWLISRKCDGIRCVAFYRGGEVKFLSRQNKEFYTLANVAKDIMQFAKDTGMDNFVFDGEVCKVDANGNEDFQGIQKEMRKKNHTIENPCYLLFDVLTIDEFEGRTISPNFRDRYGDRLMLKIGFESKYKTLKVLEQVHMTDESFIEWQQKAKNGNWEGLMLRKDAPYKSGRSDDLLKVKKMDDAEYAVKDVIYGTLNFTEPGMGLVKEESLSAIVIEHKGNPVQVGSGFSKEERRLFYKDKSQIVGKTVTIQFFEESIDQYGKASLRFPVYKGIRDYE